MNDDAKRGRGLGRGLAALIGDMDGEVSAVERARSQRRVPIEFITPNPRNPRKSFASEDLDDLARSIREKGIVQPIIVRPVGEARDRFEIIAGERRWRAAQKIGLHEVPVLIHEASDKEALELAIIENVQRADLNPLEEALGYQQLIDEFAYSAAALAETIGKSRPHVANMLRLLKLPAEVQDLLRAGSLSAGHARALINADDPVSIARRIADAGLTVRDAEALAARPKAKKPRKPKAEPHKDADTRALEKRIGDHLGLVVSIDHKPTGAGEMTIKYQSIEQLDDLVRRLEWD